MIAAFSDYDIVKWIIIESNSTDNSTSILEQYSQKFNWVHYESIESPDTFFPSRTQKLAHARNKYIEIFQRINLESRIKFLVVCDLNNLNNKLNLDSVRSCDNINIDKWGALTANSSKFYYDIWALRHRYWNDGDCWERFSELTKIYSTKNLALWDSVYSKMINIDPLSLPIEVESAFGGLAIYKSEYLTNCQYIGVTTDMQQICEHISFNKTFIKNGGKIYINPSLINLKYTDHNLRRKYFKFYNFKYKLRQFFS